MVLPTFVKRWALQGDWPITVHGDGTQTRSFTWVGDVVAAIANAGQIPACRRGSVQYR